MKLMKKNSPKNLKTNVNLHLQKDRLEKLPLNEGITYKKLCEILDIKYYSGGTSKERQLADLYRYIDYEIKPNKKIVITKIFEEPIEKKYYYPQNTIYAECIEKILKKYLAGRTNDNGTTYINAQHLYLVLGMINNDFITMQKGNGIYKLKEDLRVNYGWNDESTAKEKSIDFYVNNFYSRTKSKFSSIINSTFNSLDNKNLLIVHTVYSLVFEEEDEHGNKIITQRYTNDEEIKKVIKIRNKVMLEMGFKTEWDAMHSRQSQQYYNRINSELRYNYFPNLSGVYKYYKILYNLEDIKHSLKQDEEEVTVLKQELNQNILDFINKQANKNYLKTIDVESGTGIKFTENYLMAQIFLSDKLIKIN